jgi:hypothetical protein
MNNRLADLPAWQDEYEDSDEEADTIPQPGDVEMQQSQKHQQPDYMDNFFREVDSIKADIDAVGLASKQISQIHEQALSATTTEEEENLSTQLKPLIDSSNNRAKRTKTLLGLLKEETEKLKNDGTLKQSDIR